MLADPDELKVQALVNRLSKFYWSVLPPEQCVLPDGTGIGRIAYDDIAAFNIAWCAFKPKTHKDHELAITTSVQLRRKILDTPISGITFRDAVMLLSPAAFSAWLDKNRKAMHDPLYKLLLTASANRGTF